MLTDRLRTSAVLIVAVSILLFLDLRFPLPAETGGVWLLPLLLFFAIGTARDVAQMLEPSLGPIDRGGIYGATSIITLSAATPLAWGVVAGSYPDDCPVGRVGWIAIGAGLGTVGILVREMIRFGRPDRGPAETQLKRLAAGLFVAHYVGVPMALLVAVRGLGPTPAWGVAALVSTIAITKSGDAGAYAVGKLWGRRKLIPWLSPGKTWEGAIGGVIASTIVALICFHVTAFPTGEFDTATVGTEGEAASTFRWPGGGVPLGWALVVGPLLASAGMLGDLAESLIKRLAGVKDSGTWLPGLGGVWDVTDSLLVAVIPAFLCFAALA